MQINVVKDLQTLECDGIGMLLFKTYDAGLLPEGLKVQLDQVIEKKAFDLSSGKSRVFLVEGQTYLVVGLGNEIADLDLDDLRLATVKLIGLANEEKIKTLGLYIQHNHIETEHAFCAISESAVFANYQFNAYKSEPVSNTLESLSIVCSDNEVGASNGVAEGLNLAEGVSIARKLVDEPACSIYPETLAAHAVTYGQTFGFEVEVMEEEAIKALGMHAYLAVGQGSARGPRLIVMRYKGDPESTYTEGWVGKGLTYDSGGMSIKTADGMEHMKSDMGGAAAVIGAMAALAKSKKKVNVTAVVAACENMISGNSYKPGDILSTMGGKTIYIGNTDAEGRLTLVDAITYIVRKEGVSTVIDLATLTGAALMALGNVAALTVSNDDELYERFESSAKQVGEKVWRMPAFKEYEKLIVHHEADLTNMAGRPGSVTAALVLREFVEKKPWIHVDIAGVAHYTAPMGLYPKGASGYGVKTLFESVKRLAK